MSNKEQRFTEIVHQLRALIDESILDESEELQALAQAASALRPDDVAELIIGARKFRNKHLGSQLFGEPAWDILLQLHVAHYRQQAISVSAAVTLGETAPTTGSRWLKLLEDEGLIERRGDPNDNRRSFVALTEDGKEKLDRYIAAYSDWVATKASLRKL